MEPDGRNMWLVDEYGIAHHIATTFEEEVRLFRGTVNSKPMDNAETHSIASQKLGRVKAVNAVSSVQEAVSFAKKDG